MDARGKSRHAGLVSLSGIDGAGKSTQIEALRSRAENAGLRVVSITFWDQVARLTRIREVSGHTLFRGDKGVGTPEAPIVRRDKNVRSWWMTGVRLGLYFLDAISLRYVVQQAVRAPADLVICDRYLYDELANLNLRNSAMRIYVRFVLKLIPRPDAAFFLDADPVQAFARKPEYPLEFLHSSRQSYYALAELVDGMTIIPAMSARNVELQVLEHALTLPCFDGSQRERAALHQRI